MEKKNRLKQGALHGTASIDGGRLADGHGHAQGLEAVEAMAGSHSGLRSDTAASNDGVDRARGKGRF